MNKHLQHFKNILLFIGVVALIVHSIITHQHIKAIESNNKVSHELVEAIKENNKKKL